MKLLNEDDLSEVLENISLDGRNRNIICDCPYCGKSRKFGISLVKEGNPWNCFSCTERGRSIKLMTYFNRMDLIQEFLDVKEDLENPLEEIKEEDLDLELEEVDLPPETKRVLDDDYLEEERGWWEESLDNFPVFRSRNFKYKDYIVIGVYMYDTLVGYVSRHTWRKERISRYNKRAKREGGYQILRYRNSEGNEFSKMLGGMQHVVEGQTDTAILVEGYMDIIRLTQELDLFSSNKIRSLCTFGKKISPEQIYHLQSSGIKNIIVWFDDDAIDTIKDLGLEKFFNVLIASTDDADGAKSGYDVDDLNADQIEQCLSMARTPISYFYDKIEVFSF